MEEAEERLRALQEELSSLQELRETVGWKELMKIAEGQLKLRLPGILTKTENILETIGKEFEKGEVAGIELFCSLPGIRVESIKQDMDKLEKELGYAPGERTDTGEGGDDRDPLFEGDAPRV